MYTIGEFIFTKEDELHYSISLNPKFMNTDKKIAYIFIDSGVLYLRKCTDGHLLKSKSIKITEFPFDAVTLFDIIRELYMLIREDGSITNNKALPFMRAEKGFNFTYHILYDNPLRAFAIHYPATTASCFGYIEVVDTLLRVLDANGNLICIKNIKDIKPERYREILSDVEYSLIHQYAAILD